MSIAQNFPNIKPSLMLSFADTKQLDNRVTFTRSTSAVYYDGKTTAMAEQNLLLQSQTFGTTWAVNAASITSDTTTAPDGTTTADTLTAIGTDACLTYQAKPTSTAGTISCYIKKGTSNYAYIYVDNPSLTGNAAIFDINTGVIGSYAGAFTSSSIQSVGNGWYRCIATFTGISGTNIGIGVCDTSSTTPCTSGRTIYLWGAQLEQRSSATAYTATTTQPITNYIPVLLTAGGNQPRFDCNPTTGESLGLLIEEQRTNALFYSVYSGLNWTGYSSTLTANYTIAPDASQTACRIVGSPSFTTRIDSAVPLTTSTTYAASIWMKSNTSSSYTIVLQIGDADVQTCLVTPQWQRFTGAGSPVQNNYSFVDLTSSSNCDISAWGAQLETGAFATSYIKTSGSAATRTADAASMTGANFSSWYSQGEGTMYGELSSALTTGFRLLTFSDGTSNNQNWISENSAAIYRNADYQYYASGFNLGNNGKIAMTYAPNDAQNAVNGTYGSVDGTVNLANNLTTALIGANASLDVGSLTIKKLAFYPQRLSQTNLQALTS